MNHRHFLLGAAATVAMFFTTFGSFADSDFAITAGPEGGRIDALAVQDGTAWAATGGGIFRSADLGLTWAHIADNPAQTIWRQLLVADNAMLAVAWNHSVYRSNDAGQTWTAVNFGVGAFNHVQLGNRGNELFALIDATPQTLLFSDDGGVTWISRTLPASNIGEMLINAGAIVITEGFNGLHRSTDSGLTWTPVKTMLPNDMLVRHSVGGNSMLIQGMFFGGVFRSDDSGLSWKQIDAPFPGAMPAGVADQTATMYAVYSNNGLPSLFQSVDDGATWQPVSTSGLPPHFISNSSPFPLAASGQQLLLALPFSSAGVFRSSDGGATLMPSNAGLIATNIDTLGTAGDVIVASGPVVGANYRSADDGDAWTQTDLPHVKSYVASENNFIIAGSRDSGAFRSTNAGASWSPVNTGLPHYGSMTGDAIEPLNDLALHNGFIFAATGGGSQFIGGDDHCGCTATASGDGVYRSADNGATWQRVSTGLPVNMVHFGDQILRPISALLSVDGALIAATVQHGVFRSTNNGATWLPTSGAPGGRDLALFNGAAYLSTDSGTLYRSLNNGQTWSILNTNLPSGTFARLHAHQGALYAVAGPFFNGAPGVYRSADGQTWTPVGTAVGDKIVLSITSLGDALLIGVENRGVWKLSAPIAEDLNNDGGVDVFDLFILLGAWGSCAEPCPPSCDTDFNSDCSVDVFDLFQLLSAWSN